jgi:hypothetical protein
MPEIIFPLLHQSDKSLQILSHTSTHTPTMNASAVSADSLKICSPEKSSALFQSIHSVSELADKSAGFPFDSRTPDS